MSPAEQLPFPFGHRPSLADADFLVADANREAAAWMDRWPAWPGPALVVHGPPGCGKTHLASIWCVRAGGVLVAVDALAGADLPALTAQCRAVAVDAADMLAGRAAEEALLHLYNVMAAAGGHVLLTARAPPARWTLDLPDLASRLRAAPAVAVAAPDDAMLDAVLVKLFADRQLRVGADVIAYLRPRIERSFAAAGGIVAALDAAALARRRPITPRLAAEVLREVEGEGGDIIDCID